MQLATKAYVEAKQKLIEGSNLLTMEKLKKQIKYSKNPLEVKMLNKQLNQTYK